MLKSWSMKIFILGIAVSFLLITKAYSLSCGLESDVLNKHTRDGYLEINIYNSNSKPVNISSIKYYDSNNNLVREYDLFKRVNSKSNLAFNHSTNSAFLKKVTKINFGCKISEPRYIKPKTTKPKSGAQKWLDKIRGN